jgi:aryl-alcohol dehydrogenase-like predicted oxidoreductase
VTLPRVHLASLGQEVSALGFGCASLGSRIAPGAGLAALERAFDAGVSWFDVAPAYGDGQAEALLGQFARSRRDQVQIVTKVGLAPPRPGLKQRLARPALRLALSAMPGLRASIRKRRPANVKVPLSPELITSSIDASLRRLGTDHVDVLALHAAEPDDVARAEIAEALEAVVKAGKARVAGIASSPEAAIAGLRAAPVYRLVQFGSNAFEPGLTQFRALGSEGGADVVTHSVYGNEGHLAALTARLASDSALAAAFASEGYAGEPRSAAADFMADYAFAANANGVVIMSMFKASHLAANVARRSRAASVDATSLQRLADLAAAHDD